MRCACGLLLASMVVAGCESPEARRSRGGGPGADSQNRAEVVEMHAGSRQYFDTPVLIPEAAQ